MLVGKHEPVTALVAKVLKGRGQRVDAARAVKGTKGKVVKVDGVCLGRKRREEVHDRHAGGAARCVYL